MSRWPLWAHGAQSGPSEGLYTHAPGLSHWSLWAVGCVSMPQALKALGVVLSPKPSEKPTHSLTSPLNRESLQLPRWETDSTKNLPTTGTGGLCGGSREGWGSEPLPQTEMPWLDFRLMSSSPHHQIYSSLVFFQLSKWKHMFYIFFFSGLNPWIMLDSFLSLLPHVKIHHTILSAPFSNWNQNLVTSPHLHCHHPGLGHHCLFLRLLKWLLNHFSCFCPYSKSVLTTLSDPLQMYVTSLLYTLF